VVSGSFLWLSVLLVTYWWVAGGGVRDLGGLQSGLTSVGRISALMASDLLLVQVILMARVPLLERAFGQDRLTAQHRVVGFTSFNLMLVHVALITWGYAAGRLADTPGTLWNLTLDYPGMLLAVAGTGCLVMVVVTSARAARRRLRYAVVAPDPPLRLPRGRPGPAAPAVDRAGIPHLTRCHDLLVERLGPRRWDRPGVAHRSAAVAHRAPRAAGQLRGRRGGRRRVGPRHGPALSHLHAEAGQFFNWRFHGREGWTRANPYSLSAAPDGETLRITIKDSGDGSAAAAGLHPGTRVLVEGPYGRLSPRARSREPGEDQSDRRGLQVVHLPGRRRATGSWLGDGMGLHSDVGALLAWVPDLAARDVYVCGPTPWTDAVRRAVQAAGLPPEQLHVENFGW